MCHAHLALRLALSFAMSDLRAFQLPRTGYHARLFIASSALFPLLHPILPAQKTPRPQMQPRQTCVTHARLCLAACVEPCNVRPAGLPAATNGLSCAFVLMRFLHYFHSFISSSGTKKRPGFKCGRSKHAHRGLPSGLSLTGHGRRTSANADGRP